jgi:4'-phosphopantetheinyl transferase
MWRAATPVRQPGSAVWHVDLEATAPIVVGKAAWLSADEAARADRFLRREDRDRFIRSHQALRYILAGYLDRSPEAVRFRIGPPGKPELDVPDQDALHFNLSHSGRHALIGVADGISIGVDVEAIRPFGDPMAVARAHFHPGEIADLARLSGAAREAAFFACWTRKEAVVKALGTGLSFPLDRFRVALPPADPAVLRWEGAGDPTPEWTIHHLDPGVDAVGAAAIAQACEPCIRYRLPPDWAEAA